MPTSTDKVFSLEDVQSVLADFFANELSQAKQQGSGVTQYVGARYVPLFANPIEWDSARAYEPLTIVLHQGNSYTSRQSVPTGVDISDDTFWAMTGNYNAQIEQYRAEVAQYDSAIKANTSAIKTNETYIAAETSRAIKAEASKAPIAHASEETTYGVGSETNYGHVRLAVDGTPADSDATAGIAATPKTVDAQVTSVKNELNQSINTLNSTVAKLQNKITEAGKITSLYVIGDSYLAGHNPDGNVTGYGQLINQALNLNAYKDDAVGGTKWDASTVNRINNDVKNYDNLLIALGHNNMTSNTVDVEQYVAACLNKLQSIGYKGHVFLCSTLATARYACTRMLAIDEGIVCGMQAASYTFPCTFIANGWSWLIDSADYGSTDNGQHPKQTGQNIIAANIINGMYGGSTLNAAKSYGGKNGVYVTRNMMSLQINVSGATGNAETVLYKPAIPFRFLDTFFFTLQGNDGSTKSMSFTQNDGAKIIYTNVTNAVYGSISTSLPEAAPA